MVAGTFGNGAKGFPDSTLSCTARQDLKSREWGGEDGPSNVVWRGVGHDTDGSAVWPGHPAAEVITAPAVVAAVASAEATVDMVTVPLMPRQDSTAVTAVEETLVITLVRILSKLAVVPSDWAMLKATAGQHRQSGQCLGDAAGHSWPAETKR